MADGICEPASHLEDSEAAYERVLAMAETYDRRGQAEFPPIVVRASAPDTGYTVLDGLHRLSAVVVDLTTLEAYEVWPPRAR